MNMKKIIGIILAVVALGMVGFGIYIMNSSKYIFKTALSGVFDYAVDSYDKMTDELEELDKIKKFKVTSNNSFNVQGIDFAKIDADMYADIQENKMYMDLNSSILDSDFIGLEGLIEDNKLYFKIKEVFDNFYYADIEMSGTEIETLEDSEFELLMNHLEESILKDLSDKDLEKSSQTLQLGNKNYKTTKVALKLSERKLSDIVYNFLTSISNDNDAIQVLQKFEKTLTKQSIEEAAKQFKDNSNLDDTSIFTLSFYVEGFGNLRRVEFAGNEEVIDSEPNTYLLTFDMYSNDGNKTYLFTSKINGEEIYSINVEKLTDRTSKLNINGYGINIKGTLASDDKSSTIELEIISEGSSLGKVTYKETEVKKDEEYKLELTVDIDNMMKIVSENNLVADVEMEEIDVEGALSYEEITEEDIEVLQIYLQEKLSLLGLSNNDYSLEENDEE